MSQNNLEGLIIPTIFFNDGTSLVMDGIFGLPPSRCWWAKLSSDPPIINPTSFDSYRHFYDTALAEIQRTMTTEIHSARGRLFEVYNDLKVQVNTSREQFIAHLRKRYHDLPSEEFIEWVNLNHIDEWLNLFDACINKIRIQYPDFNIDLDEDVTISKDFGIFDLALYTPIADIGAFKPYVEVNLSYTTTILLKTIFTSKNIKSKLSEV